MAIDTAEKRRAVAARVHRLPMVTPDAAQPADWRMEAGRMYGGIGAGAPVVPASFLTTYHPWVHIWVRRTRGKNRY